MKYLIPILLSITVLSCTPTTSIEKTTTETTKEDAKLFVAYKSPSRNILVSGHQLEFTTIQFEYDNPTSDTPSNQKTTKGKTKTLPQKTIDELTALLKTSGFYELEAAYGATENQRYYPYYITVRKGSVVKAVTFRSNPDTAKRPLAFKQVENYLLKLIK